MTKNQWMGAAKGNEGTIYALIPGICLWRLFDLLKSYMCNSEIQLLKYLNACGRRDGPTRCDILGF